MAPKKKRMKNDWPWNGALYFSFKFSKRDEIVRYLMECVVYTVLYY